jgi:hypothetical protein
MFAAHPSQGFVVATSRGGLAVYERDSESKPYRLSRAFAVAPNTSVGVGSGRHDTRRLGSHQSSLASRNISMDGAASSVSASAAAAATLRSLAAEGAAAAAAPSPCRACSLAVSPLDDSLALLTADGQLLSLAAAPGERRGAFTGLTRLAPGFHSGEVTGLATCVRRAVVATSGADRTLRLWNYQDRTAEMVGGGLGSVPRV